MLSAKMGTPRADRPQQQQETRPVGLTLSPV
jgi:hypothetical protein